MLKNQPTNITTSILFLFDLRDHLKKNLFDKRYLMGTFIELIFLGFPKTFGDINTTRNHHAVLESGDKNVPFLIGCYMQVK